jgi:small subunit ribosomal protein S21
MVFIKLSDHMHPEVAIRKFKKKCEKSGIFLELRKRECYEKPSILAKRDRMLRAKRSARDRMLSNV